MDELGRHERVAFVLAVATVVLSYAASYIDPWVSIVLALFAWGFVGYALGAQAERTREGKGRGHVGTSIHGGLEERGQCSGSWTSPGGAEGPCMRIEGHEGACSPTWEGP